MTVSNPCAFQATDQELSVTLNCLADGVNGPLFIVWFDFTTSCNCVLLSLYLNVVELGYCIIFYFYIYI